MFFIEQLFGQDKASHQKFEVVSLAGMSWSRKIIKHGIPPVIISTWISLTAMISDGVECLQNLHILYGLLCFETRLWYRL